MNDAAPAIRPNDLTGIDAAHPEGETAAHRIGVAAAETAAGVTGVHHLGGSAARALDAAGPSPAERLDALIRAVFAPVVSAPARLKAWCAFWGEAQSRPVYQETCGENDRVYVRTLEETCAALIAETGAGHDPARVARILRVTVEGTWLDLITLSEPYSRDEALATAFACAAAFFPDRFDAGGLIG